jgi:hypothetical protein
MMSTQPHVLCLTPVRNEAQRLEAFLAAASTWADAIVVADQHSEDGSREIAAAHPKVLLVDNPGEGLDNAPRQRMMVDRARAEFSGPRVLLLIDADEVLTAGATATDDWQALLRSPPGTPIRMRWIHPLPDGRRAWVQPRLKRFGLVDDDSEPASGPINPGRLSRGSRPPLELGTVGVVHHQFVDWENMKAKQRWYQGWERLHFPEKRPSRIYRQYHWMDALRPEAIVPVDPRWSDGYEHAGIAVGTLGAGNASRWDEQTLALIRDHGAGTFRQIDVWDHDWSEAAGATGIPVPDDPRRRTDRWALQFLQATQGAKSSLVRGLAARAVALAGW